MPTSRSTKRASSTRQDRPGTSGIIRPRRERPLLSKYEIKSGWDIPATLESEVNTDLPGEVKAIVRENVYDTASGQYLLIPQGSRLIGRYDNRVSYGQSRASSCLVAANLPGRLQRGSRWHGGARRLWSGGIPRPGGQPLRAACLDGFDAECIHGRSRNVPAAGEFGVRCFVAERGCNSSPWPAIRPVGHGGDAQESEYPAHSEDSSGLSLQCARES
jgi:hypothetical protein